MTLNNRSKDQMLLYQCYINAYLSLEWIKMSALSIQSCRYFCSFTFRACWHFIILFIKYKQNKSFIFLSKLCIHIHRTILCNYFLVLTLVSSRTRTSSSLDWMFSTAACASGHWIEFSLSSISDRIYNAINLMKSLPLGNI